MWTDNKRSHKKLIVLITNCLGKDVRKNSQTKKLKCNIFAFQLMSLIYNYYIRKERDISNYYV